MFRFNNPDALLVLAMVAGAYATVRAIETASTRWLALGYVVVSIDYRLAPETKTRKIYEIERHERLQRLMRLAASAMKEDVKREYTALVRDELASEVHGEVDELSWNLKQQYLHRSSAKRSR